MTELKNIFVIRTHDANFEQWLIDILSKHCIKETGVSVAYFGLNEFGAEADCGFVEIKIDKKM